MTSRNLKQIITIESLGVRKKHAASRGFFATARLLFYLFVIGLRRSCIDEVCCRN